MAPRPQPQARPSSTLGILPLESVLVGLGVLLALVGAILLLLTWLSRRAADPLLR